MKKRSSFLLFRRKHRRKHANLRNAAVPFSPFRTLLPALLIVLNRDEHLGHVDDDLSVKLGIELPEDDALRSYPLQLHHHIAPHHGRVLLDCFQYQLLIWRQTQLLEDMTMI